jgi:hypothetical protein
MLTAGHKNISVFDRWQLASNCLTFRIVRQRSAAGLPKVCAQVESVEASRANKKGNPTMKHDATIALQISIMAINLFSGAIARAQTTGGISGTVKDPDGSVIADIAVIAKNAATGAEQRAVTNAQGFYAFPTLPVGKYELDAFRTGFKPYKRIGSVIDVDTELQVDILIGALNS